MLILLMTKPVLVNIKSLMISENWGSIRNIKSHNCVFIELPPHAMVSSLKILCMVYVPVPGMGPLHLLLSNFNKLPITITDCY